MIQKAYNTLLIMITASTDNTEMNFLKVFKYKMDMILHFNDYINLLFLSHFLQKN